MVTLTDVTIQVCYSPNNTVPKYPNLLSGGLLDQDCCLTGTQEPGAPKKLFWTPEFLQQHLAVLHMLGS